MCQMDAHIELILEQASFNPAEPPSNGDEGSDVRLASQVEKATAAPSSNESGKKKRVHRAAKLKQCKMDARREQWLAQVSSKFNKPGSCASSQDDRDAKELQSSPGALDMGTVDSKDRKEPKLKRNVAYAIGGMRSEKQVLESNASENHQRTLTLGGSKQDQSISHPVLNLPKLKRNVAYAIGGMRSEKQVLESNASENHQRTLTLGGSKQDQSISHPQNASSSNCGPLKPRAHLDEEEVERKTGDVMRLGIRGFTTTWSSSETSTSRSNSSHASSSSGSDDDNEVEDWEVVADALHVQASVQEVKSVTSESQNSTQNRPHDHKSTMLSSADLENYVLKPESKFRPGNFGSRMRMDVGCAWRPDDVSRPPTLPRLSKQHSFPLQSGTSVWGTSHGSVWGLPPPPSHCPICTEELDTTDSSFVPCSCGFRLCLFCHHRIVIGDGRCPGCRKSYNLEAALKLSRTSSVRPRI